MVKTNIILPVEKEFCLITSEQFVKSAARDLGKSTSSYGHWKHAIVGLILCLVPSCCNRGSRSKYWKEYAVKVNTPKEQPVVVVDPKQPVVAAVVAKK